MPCKILGNASKSRYDCRLLQNVTEITYTIFEKVSHTIIFQTVRFLQFPQQVPQLAWRPEERTMLVKDECPVSFMLLCTSCYDPKRR